MNSFSDEKEKRDPIGFRDVIVAGLNIAGSEDLEAVSAFLDKSGSTHNYRLYADSLIHILIAGGLLGECWHCHEQFSLRGQALSKEKLEEDAKEKFRGFQE